MLACALALSACAHTPLRPALVGGTAFQLTPAQCLDLAKERRAYVATQEASAYASGLGAVLTGVLLAVLHGDRAEVVAPAISTGLTSVAAGVGVFASSQAKSLEEDLAAGGCPR